MRHLSEPSQDFQTAPGILSARDERAGHEAHVKKPQRLAYCKAGALVEQQSGAVLEDGGEAIGRRIDSTEFHT